MLVLLGRYFSAWAQQPQRLPSPMQLLEREEQSQLKMLVRSEVR